MQKLQGVPTRPPSEMPLLVGIWTPVVYRAHTSLLTSSPSKRHLEKFSLFAGLTGVSNTHTHPLSDHGTCDVCSDRPHLCNARDADSSESQLRPRMPSRLAS